MSGGGIDVLWFEAVTADLPAGDDWLGQEELRVLRAFRVPKRRDDWRLGRWTAKHAVAAYLNMAVDPASLAAIEIRPADSGAPEVFLSHQPAAVSISISHCNGAAVCAVAQSGVALGCDLEVIAPRSDAFIADYFIDSERALIAEAPVAQRAWLATFLWSAKESALKALHEGLRLDTRSVHVQSAPPPDDDRDDWRPLTVSADCGCSFAGWSRRDPEFVRTVVSSPAAGPLRTVTKSPIANHKSPESFSSTLKSESGCPPSLRPARSMQRPRPSRS